MKKKKNNLNRTLLIIACVVLALVLVIMLAVTIYTKYMLGQINYEDPGKQTLSSSELEQLHQDLNQTDAYDPTFEGVELDPTDVTWATIPPEEIEKPFKRNENMLNIMLVGQDYWGVGGRSRSDSMIICSLNKETGKLTMTSLLRDMYVQIPGRENNRLNAAFGFGGIELFKETLKLNFGIELDGFIVVNFTSFVTLVDELGGVKIALTPKEAAYLGLQVGTQRLDGKEALAYSRIRKIDTDFNRTNRQRTVITALLNQYRNMDITKMHSVLQTCLRLITTDLTEQQIVQYAVELFPLLKDLTIESDSIPSKTNYVSSYIQGRYVLLPDFPAIRAKLDAVMNGEEYVPAE